MKEIPLREYLAFLDSQSPADFRDGTADEFLAGHCLPEDELAPFIFFREETYGRNLVAKSDKYELLILTWLANQRTPIHDHFGQRCWMTILSGELSFRNYETPKDFNAPLVPLGGVQKVGKSNQVYIDDTLAVHSIANAAKQPAISVHLYAGPVPRCSIYNEKAHKFETITLGYFTYLGEPVLSTHPEAHQ
ncbi:MAG: cysteine dioxygenase family protein [Deltaproteobacteria bacterium]|nr:cysteine dioxygenase family protein [Deltaproteobacteria bacterium]